MLRYSRWHCVESVTPSRASKQGLAFCITRYYGSITGERITMKRCTDALTWFPQVGLGLVQRRQSRGLGLAAGRQRGRSSSSSRPPARRRRWRCRRTGATADDVFQAARCVRAWTWMDARRLPRWCRTSKHAFVFVVVVAFSKGKE
jgi:hypothetical protein